MLETILRRQNEIGVTRILVVLTDAIEYLQVYFSWYESSLSQIKGVPTNGKFTSELNLKT